MFWEDFPEKIKKYLQKKKFFPVLGGLISRIGTITSNNVMFVITNTGVSHE